MFKKKSGFIFLKPLPDGKWIGYFFPRKRGVPSDYIFIAKEGNYPVTLYYERYDIMGSRVVESHICHNREELLGELEWCGQCRNRIRCLWNHDLDSATDKRLFDLYQACDAKRNEIDPEELAALMGIEIIDVFETTEGTQYVVELEPGFAVEVKHSVECNLTYIMQNHDGSTVYREDDPDMTLPDYEYDEDAVLSLVKAHLKESKT